MDYTEESPLLATVAETFDRNRLNAKELSLFFAVICIVDVFGVFPIIVLPAAIIRCGWYGVPLVICLFSIQIYTAALLGKCWVIAEYIDKSIILKNRYPYAALAEMAYGKHVSKLVTILLDVTVFVGGIPNILVAAQNLQLFGMRITENSFSVSYCYWMIILGIILCPFLWLGSPKDMKVLCSFSVLAVFSASILTWICIFNDDSIHINAFTETSDTGAWKSLISAYGIIAFQFDIHPMLLTIQVDMKNKAKISWAIFYGFIASACLFLPTTIIAALKYGKSTSPNILQGLPPSFWLYVTVLLVTMQLCMTSAVGNSALYQHIEDYLNISREFNYERCVLRSTLTILAVFFAESVPKFDLVMRLIGGTLTGPLVFIFPPLFYLRLTYLKKKFTNEACMYTANHIMYHCDSTSLSSSVCSERCFTSVQKQNFNFNLRGSTKVDELEFIRSSKDYYLLNIFLTVFVIIFGAVATCTTTYINVSDAITYTSFSPPCLFNMTRN